MSETSTMINAPVELAGWVRNLADMYCKDLRALTPEGYSVSAGGVARTAQNFTAEVAGFNFMITSIINGEAPSMPNDEEREAFVASLDTIEKGCEAITNSANAFASALESSDRNFAEMITVPWGAQMSLYAFANIAANHIMYHDAQLNFIQSLHGDAEMHWM